MQNGGGWSLEPAGLQKPKAASGRSFGIKGNWKTGLEAGGLRVPQSLKGSWEGKPAADLLSEVLAL